MSLLTQALRRRPSLPTAIVLLALAVATTGTAAAATGQLVNIADPSNAAHVARVSTAGALSTTLTNPPYASRPWAPQSSSQGSAITVSEGSYAPVTTATTGVVALTRIELASGFGTGTRMVRIYSTTVTPGSSVCTYPNDADNFQLLGEYTLDTGNGTVTDNLAAPIMLKPVGTRPWCLIAASFAAAGANGGADLVLNGFVVSGTPPVGTLGLAGAGGAKNDPLAPKGS